MVKLANIYFYTQSKIYLSYLTIPILWSSFMPIMLYVTWLNYRWLDISPKKRSSECWAWFMTVAKAKHFEMTAVTLILLLSEIALIFAGLFSNRMIHFPPLGQGVYATTNSTSTENLIELPGVYAQYRIGPRLDEVVATGDFAGNTALQLPNGPWILSGYWRMTPSCLASIEAAIPSFSKGVRWSSMAAIMMLLGITIAFDVARLVAAKATGEDSEVDNVGSCCTGCCGSREPDERLDEDDEGCLKEFFGCQEDGACDKLCGDPDPDSDNESETSSQTSRTSSNRSKSDREESDSESDSVEDSDAIEKVTSKDLESLAEGADDAVSESESKAESEAESYHGEEKKKGKKSEGGARNESNNRSESSGRSKPESRANRSQSKRRATSERQIEVVVVKESAGKRTKSARSIK